MSAGAERPFPGSSREWTEHARSDLALARVGRDAEGVLLAQICFHAQQAVEKALKAVLLDGEIAFPLTHDLEALTALAPRALEGAENRTRVALDTGGG